MRLLPLLVVAGFAALLADRQLRLRRALNDAATDPLTGIANRRGLAAAFARRAGDPASRLLFLDLIGFKAVNDRLGHIVGDRVLKEVATRLAQSLPPSALLARVGGDEFVVLGSPDLAPALMESLAVPIPVAGGAAVSVGVRIGVADAGLTDLGAALASAQARMAEAG